MTCTNPTCPNPKKNHLFLFPGLLCPDCKHLYVAPVAPRKPAGRHRTPKLIKEAVKVRPNSKRRLAGRQRLKTRYVVKYGWLYKQPKNGCGWGSKSTAKVYMSLAKAGVAIREIGYGKAVKV
jgi:hypothetical protein